MAILQTIIPNESHALSRRLWLRGAKRLGLLAFDAEQINERAIDPDGAPPVLTEAEPPTLFGASLSRQRSATSPLTPSKPDPAAAGAVWEVSGITIPSASYWAFGRQSFALPERLAALPERRKHYKLSIIFTKPVLRPAQRTAHGQAFLEYSKWEIARLITEALPKFEVTYLVQDGGETESWEHYDVILRSRKPELVHFLTGATADEQMALAKESDAVLTDHVELGAAVLGHGRRAVVLGGAEGQPQGALQAGSNFLPEWSFDRSTLDKLIHPLPKGKPVAPEYLTALQNTVSQELASGSRWFEA